MADFRNLQERTRREVESTRQFAIQRFAKDLIESVDNLDRALTTVSPEKLVPSDGEPHDTTKDLVNLHDGLKMTEAILMQTLKKHGLERFDPSETQDHFDPNLHEATFQAPVPDKEDGAVFLTQQKGFILNGRVLRVRVRASRRLFSSSSSSYRLGLPRRARTDVIRRPQRLASSRTLLLRQHRPCLRQLQTGLLMRPSRHHRADPLFLRSSPIHSGQTCTVSAYHPISATFLLSSPLLSSPLFVFTYLSSTSLTWLPKQQTHFHPLNHHPALDYSILLSLPLKCGFGGPGRKEVQHLPPDLLLSKRKPLQHRHQE